MNGLLPTRRDEAWRYADHAALAAVWPVPAPKSVQVGAWQFWSEHRVLDATAPGVVVEGYDIDLAAGARAELVLVVAGGRYRRIAVKARLGAGAEFDLRVVMIAQGKTQDRHTDAGSASGAGPNVEIVGAVTHAEPGARSQQTVRAIAGARGTASYLGGIAVARGAQKTDAAQSFRAILLDRTATANARPELEIFADDVKCAHGAAVGELDPDTLFYLQSRGLGEAAARRLVLGAFVAGAFEGLKDEEALTAQALTLLEVGA